MSKSKKSKAQRELEIKKYKRNRLIMILAGIVMAVGVITAGLFLVDWNNVGTTPHVHGDSCAHS